MLICPPRFYLPAQVTIDPQCSMLIACMSVCHVYFCIASPKLNQSRPVLSRLSSQTRLAHKISSTVTRQHFSPTHIELEIKLICSIAIFEKCK